MAVESESEWQWPASKSPSGSPSADYRETRSHTGKEREVEIKNPGNEIRFSVSFRIAIANPGILLKDVRI